MKKTDSPPWSVPVAVEDIPETGLHRDIDASAAERAGVAEIAAVRDVPRLTASFDLTRLGAGVRVEGRVSATVGQTCVVSLEPVENEVEEAIGLTFAPVAADVANAKAASGDEAPEPLVGGAVDLGAIATEFLILAIDPYPRKAGAQFVPPKAEADGPHPFAALEALKKRPGGGER
jgi:uncharacterized metal-binding protein YceD (DUF177 family)